MFTRKMLWGILMISLFAGLLTFTITYETEPVKAAEIAGETTAYAGQKFSDLDAVINDGTYPGVSGSL
jgi:hypothetical protein